MSFEHSPRKSVRSEIAEVPVIRARNACADAISDKEMVETAVFICSLVVIDRYYDSRISSARDVNRTTDSFASSCAK